jgi:hypothetical protein
MQEAWVYLILPEAFESISSRAHKKQIQEAFKSLLNGAMTDNRDRDLLEIRKLLTPEAGEGFHFYRPPIIERWQKPKEAKSEAAALTNSKQAVPEAVLPRPVPAGDAEFEELRRVGVELFLEPPDALKGVLVQTLLASAMMGRCHGSNL